MTGPSGNRLSICPLRFLSSSWVGDPESLGTNRSAYYPRDQSLFVYYCTMNFKQGQGLAKSRSHAHV